MGSRFNRVSLVLSLCFGSYFASPVVHSSQSLERDPILERFAALADPPEYHNHEKRVSAPTSAVSAEMMASYTPYTHLAAATYCTSANVSTWSCGEHCNANPGMQIYGVGGDNEEIPAWYVGYLPSMSAVVVAHRGTHPTAAESDFIDIDTFMNVLNGAFFPGLTAPVMAHEGFTNAQGRTYVGIADLVKKVMSDHGVTKVIITGHSLGGAIAVFDAIALQLDLPSTTTIVLITYGQPRVGNSELADYIDAHFPGHVRITHAQDPVPTVPGRFVGFKHSSGEIHIDGNNNWNACTGQDNTARPTCSTGAVAFIWDGKVADHSGPYNGVMFSCDS